MSFWTSVWGIFPDAYKWDVALKKVAYLIAKFGVGFLTARAVVKGQMTPDDVLKLELTVTTLVAGGLEFVHDWAKLKFPKLTWL